VLEPHAHLLGKNARHADDGKPGFLPTHWRQARAPMRERARASARARGAVSGLRTSSQVIARADITGDLVYEHSANKYW